jgi:hypothetical protein
VATCPTHPAMLPPASVEVRPKWEWKKVLRDDYRS